MTKDNFFDRKPYLDILDKRITALKDGYRQNIAIVGDELVGKTSIIYNFLNKFYDNRIIIIYLEIRQESLPSFARRFIGVLLYNFLINSDITLQENLDFLISKSEKYIPKTVEKIKRILASLQKRKKNNIFIELLSLSDAINQETSKFCVVIFDEFHNFENMGINNLYSEWSKLLILQKNTIYIIISSMKLKTKTILSKNLSLLFGNFQIINVEPFDIKTSVDYLNHRLGELNLNISLRNFLIHFTGGSPFYLELVSKELLKTNPANLADILEDLLFMPAGILNQKFSNYLKRFLDIPYSQDYIAILYLISDGHNKFKDIAHILRKQRKELMLRINHLLELDTISRNGDFLKISDRIFGFWLQFVYQERLQSLTFDSNNQKVIFRDKIESMIQEFLTNAQKTLIERTVELLHLFEDDVIQMERKRLRLTHFREIKTLEFNNQRLKEGVIGRSQDNLWIIAFKYGSLTEDDIAEFTKECKKYRHKLQRKIIVALADIDTNTRLRALEEKVWTWDLNNLNQILDLFSKPRIIAGKQ
ncbi:MAG: ATP-binding protein [Candidatus Omnitrophota bacterium]|nr:ATP-binding protein [Candidatus Omnitrophota bacterium]